MFKSLCFVIFLVIGILMNHSIASASETMYLTGATSSMTGISVSAGVTPQTSGILYGFYDVNWCSPKYTDLGFVSVCNKGKFTKIGTKGIISASGSGFLAGDIQIAKDLTGTITSTTKAVDLFEGIDSIEMRGEGTFTLRVVLVDRAYNPTYVEITYKVDKTAPTITGLSDVSSPGVNVGPAPTPILKMNGLGIYEGGTSSTYSTGVTYEVVYSSNGNYKLDTSDISTSAVGCYDAGLSIDKTSGECFAGIGTANAQIVWGSIGGSFTTSKYDPKLFPVSLFNKNSVVNPSVYYKLRVHDNTTGTNGFANYREYPVSAIMTKDIVGTTNLGTNTGVVVVGVSNLKDSTQGKANVNIETNITRYSLLTEFKKSVESKLRTVTPCTSANITNWSEFLNYVNPTPDIQKCTIKIGSEYVSYVTGNVDIVCGSTCSLSSIKRSIIVKDGSIQLKSNISTFGTHSQLLLGVITSKGLVNESSIGVDRTKKKGWLLVSPTVTNIDAFVVAEGPMVNYDTTGIVTDIKNQLHIFGGLLSLNSSTDTPPYIISAPNVGQYFNLQKLRSYSLEGEKTGANWLLKPSGLRSGGFTKDNTIPASVKVLSATDVDSTTTGSGSSNLYIFPTNGDTCGTLRCITDKDYMRYNLFIDKNNVWSSSPSALFKAN